MSRHDESKVNDFSGGGAPEPVAIVGIGCRFPGARGPEELWQLLREGRDAITEIPADRFDLPSLYDPRPGVPGKICTRHGGFLDGVDRFDAAFFGISPREATRMDPQHRLLLEVAWEALENAGHTPEHVAGSSVGVYVGMCYNDYEDLHFANPASLDIYALTGGCRSVAAGRVAHALELGGPTLAVDAACASSLLAVYLACLGLWNGDCTVALAGGVNLILEPQASIGFSRAGMLAPDGRCKFCDSRADGFVRSEGVGVVVLKPLAAARAAGDPVYAVICGGATNNDGTTGGAMMTPGRGGQEAVLREAYRRTRIAPGEVQYVEAHGTGTKVGDPVELGALGAVLGADRNPENPLIVGSIKSNLGHTEGAAGVAGLIKAALCLRHGEIPASLHVRELNPEIPWSELPIVVQRQLASWPATAGPRRAGVNSFGINGSNVHLVLEEAPAAEVPAAAAGPAAPSCRLVPLSARSPEALVDLARSWADALSDVSNLDDALYTAARRRAHHEHRLAVAACGREELRDALIAFVQGEAHAGMTAGHALPGRRPRVAFVFPGQGSQWLGMGRELMAREPVFRQAIEACDRAIGEEAGWSLLAELAADEAGSRLDQVDVIQPAIFAMQVSFAALWRSWGVEPGAVVGQSLGEVAAAHIAGALSLEDATRIICRRSRLVKATSGRGGMAMVEMSLEAARRELAGREELVSVAVSNGPESTVLSGDTAALGEILARLEARGVFCRWVKVDYASHSPQMDPLRGDLLSLLTEVAPRPGTVPIYSTVTGEITDGAGFDAAYWVGNLREPVLFADCLRCLLADGFDTFIEIGPHPIVMGAIQQALYHWEIKASTLPSARRDDEAAVLLGSLGALHVAGHPIGWERLYPQGRCVPLPRYPWQNERFWIEEPERWSAASRGGSFLIEEGRGHPLLGYRLDSAVHASIHFWQNRLCVEGLPYLGDHRVQGVAVLPAAAHLEMALGAAEQVFNGGPVVLGPASFDKVLFLNEPRQVQLVFSPASSTGSNGASFQLFSGEPDDRVPGSTRWTLHSAGTLRWEDPASEAVAEGTGPQALAAVRKRCREEVAGTELYEALAARGLEYGPAFQGVQRLWRGEGEALAEVRLPVDLESGAPDYQVHPVLLDACFHVLAAALETREGEASGDGIYLPVAIGRLWLAGRTSTGVWCHAALRPATAADSFEGDVILYDCEERPVLEVRGLVIQAVAAATRKSEEVASWLYELVWEEISASAPALDQSGGWLVLADGGGLGETLAAGLRAHGCSCLVIRPGDSAVLGPEDGRIRPGSGEDFQRLVNWAGEALPTPWQGVVHAWSLDGGAVDESSPTFLEQVESGCWSATLLVQALAGHEGSRPRLFLVTRGAQTVRVGEGEGDVTQAALWGLGRVISYEHPELRCRLVDLPPHGREDDPGRLLSEVLCDDEEPQVAYRDGGRWVARWEHGAVPAERSGELANVGFGEQPYVLEAVCPGLLDSVTLRAVKLPEPGPDEIVIRVHASALNFIDVMQAMGIYPDQRAGAIPLGLECAGEVVAMGAEAAGRFALGDRVMAVAPAATGLIRSYAVVPESWVAHVPAGLDFTTAAALPIAYLTAHFGMVHLGRLTGGERVLIHSATGGLGLAALHIARHLGAEVFATAGTEEKRALLRQMGVSCVMDSRSLAFADEVLAATGGEGVDMVVNSLVGEAIAQGLAVLRPYGRFLEFGKRDIYANTQLGLLPFQRSLSLFAIDIDRLMRERKPLTRRLLEEVAGEIGRGAYPPLPSQVWPVSQSEPALRQMAQARHTGKLVISLEEPRVTVESRAPRQAVRANGSYLITGGLGGLGLAVAEWLVGLGARHLALMGRSEPSAAAREVLDRLERSGVQVLVLRADVSREDELAAALAWLDAALPPLAGVVHAAGVLDDKTLVHLDRARLRAVMAPKVQGSWNLHRLTRGADLDFFVLFSSVASILGLPGQGNYSAANAFLDGLAHYRRRRRLPALAINWGAWSDVGLAARPDRGGRLAQRGLASMRPDQGLAALSLLFGRGGTQISVTPFDLAQWWKVYPSATRLPTFSRLAAEVASPGISAAGRGDVSGMAREAILAPSTAPSGRRSLLETYLRDLVARALGLPSAKLDLQLPINRMGIDSLMAVEVRNRAEADLGLKVPVVMLLQGPTLSQLTDQLLGQLTAAEPQANVDADADPADLEAEGLDSLLAGIDRLSESQIDALLGGLLAEGEAQP